MAELKCGANTCCYNKEAYCSKGDIMVGGRHADKPDETCCESFSDKRNDSYTSALDHACKTISIDCEATKCIYNSNFKCKAEHVDIKGCNACGCSETACGTFKEA